MKLNPKHKHVEYGKLTITVPDNHFDKGSNESQFATKNKINGASFWVLKTYKPTNVFDTNLGEHEAISGDFSCLIAPTRATTSRPTLTPEGPGHLSKKIVHQSYLRLWEEHLKTQTNVDATYKTKFLFTTEPHNFPKFKIDNNEQQFQVIVHPNSLLEIENFLIQKYGAEKIDIYSARLWRKYFREADGNPANFYLNENGHASHFDFDCMFYNVRTDFFRDKLSLNYDCVRWTSYKDICAEAEQQKSAAAVKQFYKTALMLLLTPYAADMIFHRHTTSDNLKIEMFKVLLAEHDSLLAELNKSEQFKKFIAQYSFKDLAAQIKDFFKCEIKKDPEMFSQQLQEMENRFVLLKKTLGSNKSMDSLLLTTIETPVKKSKTESKSLIATDDDGFVDVELGNAFNEIPFEEKKQFDTFEQMKGHYLGSVKEEETSSCGCFSFLFGRK